LEICVRPSSGGLSERYRYNVVQVKGRLILKYRDMEQLTNLRSARRSCDNVASLRGELIVRIYFLLRLHNGQQSDVRIQHFR
jgi:hypothetical protein